MGPAEAMRLPRRDILVGSIGEIRTLNFSVLSRAPLPVGLRCRVSMKSLCRQAETRIGGVSGIRTHNFPSLNRIPLPVGSPRRVQSYDHEIHSRDIRLQKIVIASSLDRI